MDSKKIVLFGDGCTGKSTMYNKIRDNKNDDYTFDKRYKATDEFNFTRIEINTSIGEVTIDLWDTAGQENKGGKLRDAYLKGADGVLLLYDVSEKKSATNIPEWLTQIKHIAPRVPVAVVGNKSDKLNDLDQCESVKLRDCNLQRDLGHSLVKNFLISVKNDTHIVSNSSFWSSKVTFEVEQGCLIGLEYILSNLYNNTVKIL
jgi:Ras-related protein Rab-1A